MRCIFNPTVGYEALKRNGAVTEIAAWAAGETGEIQRAGMYTIEVFVIAQWHHLDRFKCSRWLE